MSAVLAQLVAALREARVQIAVDRTVYFESYRSRPGNEVLGAGPIMVMATYDERLKQIDEALAAAGVKP